MEETFPLPSGGEVVLEEKEEEEGGEVALEEKEEEGGGEVERLLIGMFGELLEGREEATSFVLEEEKDDDDDDEDDEEEDEVRTESEGDEVERVGLMEESKRCERRTLER